jgi:hypothetical protein
MTRRQLAGLAAIALVIGAFAFMNAQPHKWSTLTADDYIEIQQLYARYNMAIDSGDAEGYAATFTPDGVFNTFKGHDALVGFINTWKEKMKGGNMRHWNTNLAISGTPDGASGAVYLLLVDVSVRPPVIAQAATYQDLLVKTPQGWRFTKRVTKGEGAPPAAAAPKPQ